MKGTARLYLRGKDNQQARRHARSGSLCAPRSVRVVDSPKVETIIHLRSSFQAHGGTHNRAPVAFRPLFVRGLDQNSEWHEQWLHAKSSSSASPSRMGSVFVEYWTFNLVYVFRWHRAHATDH
jgi:hypothetical protein